MRAYIVRYTLTDDATAEGAVKTLRLNTDEAMQFDSETWPKVTIGHHGTWVNEDGLTMYHTSPEAGCGSAWVEEVAE